MGSCSTFLLGPNPSSSSSLSLSSSASELDQVSMVIVILRVLEVYLVLPWRGLRQSVLLAVLLPRVLGVSLQLVVLLCPLLLNPLGLGRLQPLLEQ